MNVMNRSVSGSTRLAALVGWPIDHSLSPTIHNAGFASTGVDWTYVALRVRPEERMHIVSACVSLGVSGLSVTMPYKTEVASQVDRSDETCHRLRSVNTVSFVDGSTSIGHTTDGDGLVADLHSLDVSVGDQRILVVGTGGAGRSVLEALARRNPKRLLATNRSRPENTALRSITDRPIELIEWEQRDAILGEVDLVVNCTSIGMDRDGGVPIDPSRLNRGHTVVDLVYHPSRTPLINAAEENGARTIGGIGMLVQQAALQQQIWTGHLPDVAAMTKTARLALAERE